MGTVGMKKVDNPWGVAYKLMEMDEKMSVAVDGVEVEKTYRGGWKGVDMYLRDDRKGGIGVE